MKAYFHNILRLFSLKLVLATCEQLPVLNFVPELVRYWGYPVEDHYVTTYDGYILNMHRIPHGLCNDTNGTKPVVFLQHGLLGSSAVFVTGPQDRSLAYILADAGYDVWLGNTRGNTYGRAHTTLDPDQDKKKFWDFEWEQAGLYDFNASIDYILDLTNQEKLLFLAHSMGTSEFLSAASLTPELQERISAVFLLAPPSYFDAASDEMKLLATYLNEIKMAFNFLGIHELLPDTPLTSDFGHGKCDADKLPMNYEVCMAIANIVIGVSKGNLDESLLPIYFDVFPEGSSVRTLFHYAQLINTNGFFGRYDYGALQNQIIYGQDSPPSYNLSAITLPVYLFYGDSDPLVAPADVEKLAGNLPNVKLLYKVPFEGWTHNDMVYAIQAPELLYSVILEAMEAYV